jgi:hypothetical protein
VLPNPIPHHRKSGHIRKRCQIKPQVVPQSAHLPALKVNDIEENARSSVLTDYVSERRHELSIILPSEYSVEMNFHDVPDLYLSKLYAHDALLNVGIAFCS